MEKSTLIILVFFAIVILIAIMRVVIHKLDQKQERKEKRELLNYVPRYRIGDELTARSYFLLQDPFQRPTVKIMDVKENTYGVWFYLYEEFGSTYSQACLEVDKNFEKL